MNSRHCINISIQLDQVQFDKMTSGKMSKEPDDRWLIHFEGNWLYFSAPGPDI